MLLAACIIVCLYLPYTHIWMSVFTYVVLKDVNFYLFHTVMNTNLNLFVYFNNAFSQLYLYCIIAHVQQ